MLVTMKIIFCVDKLVMLLSSFLSPHFEAEVVYMSRVSVWCLSMLLYVLVLRMLLVSFASL